MLNKILSKFGYKHLELEELKEELKQLKNPYLNTAKLNRFSKKLRKDAICDCCGIKEDLTVHHLWPKKAHPTLAFKKDNVVVLCNKHHNDYHKYWKDTEATSPVTYNHFKILHQAKISHDVFSKHIETFKEKLKN